MMVRQQRILFCFSLYMIGAGASRAGAEPGQAGGGRGRSRGEPGPSGAGTGIAALVVAIFACRGYFRAARLRVAGRRLRDGRPFIIPVVPLSVCS